MSKETTAPVDQVKTGCWIHLPWNFEGEQYYCSECGKVLFVEKAADLSAFRFCYKCGTRMKEGT